MKELRLEYTIRFMSMMLSASASGYYAWLSRPPSKRVQAYERLEVEIKAAHERTRETYGPERLQRELASHKIKVSIYRIRKIRERLGIVCKQRRKYKATTDSKHTLPVAENLLNQTFTVSRPNEVWLSDITYISTGEGWLYCAAHKDVFTGEIVGYALGKQITKDLVLRSLSNAVLAKRPSAGLIHHTDRGSQYCSHAYGKLLNELKMTVSMSRKGNCYDNAPMESFWGTLKNELIYHERYETREKAMRDIREYIEIFYNRQRIQERLGYLSPVAYAQEFYKKRMAA